MQVHIKLIFKYVANLDASTHRNKMSLS